MQRLGVCLITAMALGALAAPVTKAQMPEGVTQQMIDQGKQIFNGAGICMACHGADAKGMPNLGADLTDDTWQVGDGSFEAIAKAIREGVSAGESASGSMMPPKGGSQINDEQLRAVAAYVWSLTNKP